MVTEAIPSTSAPRRARNRALFAPANIALKELWICSGGVSNPSSRKNLFSRQKAASNDSIPTLSIFTVVLIGVRPLVCLPRLAAHHTSTLFATRISSPGYFEP